VSASTRRGCGKARILLLLFAAGLTVAGAARADDAPAKWLPHVDIEAKPGTDRNLGETDFFLSLLQNDSTLLFGNARFRLDDDDSREGNLGLGLRHMLPAGWNLGGYGYLDRRRSPRGNDFRQATLGLEALSLDWDLRTNTYQAFGRRSYAVDALNTAELSGTTVVFRGGEERALCSDRGHGERLFGDMVNRLVGVLAQIDLAQEVVAIAEIEDAVGFFRTQGEVFSCERLRAADASPLEVEPAFALDGADMVAGIVCGRLDGAGHGAGAGAVAVGGHGHADAVVWASVVIDRAPGIEGVLRLVEAGEGAAGQDLGLQRAMEAFVLALRLGVIGPAMGQANIQVHQPDPKSGMLAAPAAAAGRAVVRQDTPRQAIAAERRLQPATHRIGPLVGARLDHKRIARVIVQHREWMQPRPALQWHMTLAVHLPQIVRRRMLEADEATPLAGPWPVQQPVPSQDCADRGGRGGRMAPVLQHLANLASAPGRMLGPHRQNLRLALRFCPTGARQRTAQPILEPVSPSSRYRPSHLYAVADPIPNRRHSARTFAPGVSARRQNSSRSDTIEHSLNGMGLPPLHARSVHYLPKHPLAISPVCTILSLSRDEDRGTAAGSGRGLVPSLQQRELPRVGGGAAEQAGLVA